MLRGAGNKDNIMEQDAYDNIFILFDGIEEHANLFSGDKGTGAPMKCLFIQCAYMYI